MGKHGAGELNYSSDIDLIVLFDEERLPYRGAEGADGVLRPARAQPGLPARDRTKDGYVFRTDLRLRPHPPGHPLALSSEAAELYYERHGQNWERAALIKARVVAGDRDRRRALPRGARRRSSGASTSTTRRSATSTRSSGRSTRIAASARSACSGHDLKVGRGGIREIEFFAQTQQLILGGRVPELRSPQTCEALAALAQRRWVDEAAAAELIEAYRLLRCARAPAADGGRPADPGAAGARGRVPASSPPSPAAPTRPRSSGGCCATLVTVERHYAALFESEPDLGAGGSLVFTGTADDPETLQTLAGDGLQGAGAGLGRGSAPGTTATSAPPAAPGRASC